MEYLQAFGIGAVFSFLGSIPPGTLNICVLQLGLEGNIKTALRFALAVSIIEYPYTWIATSFEDWIASTPMIILNFQLITAIVMTALGIFTLWTSRKQNSFSDRFHESGFRRGIVLSILNPMAIPFWIGVTAYLKAQHWITITTPLREHAYIFGTSAGVLILLIIFAFLAKRLSPLLHDSKLIKLGPGVMLLCLGLYAFGRYFW
jgi:threonine/homoserine/homoserine lactone efflux protein